MYNVYIHLHNLVIRRHLALLNMGMYYSLNTLTGKFKCTKLFVFQKLTSGQFQVMNECESLKERKMYVTREDACF